MNRKERVVQFGPAYYKLEFLLGKMTEALINEGPDSLI